MASSPSCLYIIWNLHINSALSTSPVLGNLHCFYGTVTVYSHYHTWTHFEFKMCCLILFNLVCMEYLHRAILWESEINQQKLVCLLIEASIKPTLHGFPWHHPSPTDLKSAISKVEFPLWSSTAHTKWSLLKVGHAPLLRKVSSLSELT